jgi:prepilin-type N-terminal cleavage/methylation domain-containing protein
MRRREARRGFTLLEVAVALAILGVGIVTCLQIFSGSLRIQDRAARQSRVVLYARGLMDAVLKDPEPTDHVEDRPVTAEGFSAHVLVRRCGPDEGCDDRELDLDEDVGLRYVQVDVSWSEGAGTKTYTLRSLRVAPENE